jgi:hypothetical protein
MTRVLLGPPPFAVALKEPLSHRPGINQVVPEMVFLGAGSLRREKL